MHRLLSHLPPGAEDAVAFVTAEGDVRWRELLRLAPEAPAGWRVGLQEANSPALARRLVGLLDHGALPVLAHPRWPRALAARAFERARVGRPWAGEELATLLFTSGTTADPKIVAHTLAAHLASARASGDGIPFGAGDRWLLSLPLCHVGGLALLFRAVVGGASLALPHPDFGLGEALTVLRPTHVSLVPTQLRALLSTPMLRQELAKLACVLVGGGPCAPALLLEAQAAEIRVRTTYGMTEFASQIATSRVGDATGGGWLLPGYGLKGDEHGQLFARGPSQFAGYLEDERLVRPFEDSWFATGDTGHLDERGALYVVGRVDNQFVSGGENVQPEAIEAAFAARGHSLVVVGVPDERFGMRPVAFTEDGAAHDALAAELLPDFARPIAWYPLGELDGLKPRRAELAERAQRLR